MRYYIQLLIKKNKPIHLQAGEGADDALRVAIQKAQVRDAVIYFAQWVALVISLIALAASFYTQKVLLFILVPIVVSLTVMIIVLTVRPPQYNGERVSVGGVYHRYRK